MVNNRRVRTLREAIAGIEGARALSPGVIDRDLPSGPTRVGRAEDAELVEGTIGPIDVPNGEDTEFTHFLDDAQRTWRAIADGPSTVLLAHTSAGLLRRVDRSMLSPEPVKYIGGLQAFVPVTARCAHAISQLVDVQMVPPPKEKEVGVWNVVQATYDLIEEVRKERERQVALFYDGSGRLMVDGTIGKARRADRTMPFVVGVVKSHQRQYVQSPESVAAVTSLRVGERSGVLRHRDQERNDVYSFYLRLHEGPCEGPLYGLVRVEMPCEQEFLAEASRIAGWILHERAPSSKPDPRSDRLLYPIRFVELVLKSRQPSLAAIRGLIGA
jgi:hypothetical protein